MKDCRHIQTATLHLFFLSSHPTRTLFYFILFCHSLPVTKLVPILSYKNYAEWSELMEAWLVKNGIWAPNEGETRPVGGPLAKAVKDWIEREAKAKAELKLYMGLD